jgi:hypothetical protein
MRLIRAEIFKLRTTPAAWVVAGALLVLTALYIILAFLVFHHHKVRFSVPTTVQELRDLVGAGYFAGVVMVPVLGVLCITTEYRHQVLTATLLVEPRRGAVLAAKVVCTVLWGVGLCILSLAMVAAMGIPLLITQGGSVAHLLHQVGPVLPGLFGAYALLALYGLGIGTLVKNQVAGVILALGLGLILEPIIVFVFSSAWHIDINFLPQLATQAVAGGIATRGQGGGLTVSALLPWWEGALALFGWGIVPTVVGYFTTLRRDVT